MAIQKPIGIELATGDLSVILPGNYIDPTSLASGTPSANTFLRGDNTWAAVPTTAVSIPGRSFLIMGA